MLLGQTNMLSTTTTLTMKNSCLILGRSMLILSRKNLDQSTQSGVCIPNIFLMRKNLKFRNTPLNIHKRHEPAVTYTVFSGTRYRSGVIKAQVFVGQDTLVADAYQ